jgi:hypothetical protein
VPLCRPGLKGEKRPADGIGAAVKVKRIALTRKQRPWDIRASGENGPAWGLTAI